MLTCDVTSHPRASSVLGHLVEGGERCEDAALVGLDDVPVLDHLVQDDVDSVQVEHDLTAPGQRNKHTCTQKVWLLCHSSVGRIRPVHSVGTETDAVRQEVEPGHVTRMSSLNSPHG